MKFIKFLLIGMLFGIIMVKSQVVSWYRIFEMFQFDSFHMYGIIGSAVVLGIITVQFIKRREMKSIDGDAIKFSPKAKSISRYLIGGILFGLGWALAGACPGPMFVLLGMGYWPLLIVIIGALTGTMLYGIVMKKLPH